MKSQSKIENDKLRNENEELKTECKHYKQLKDIEMKEMINTHRENMQTMAKQLERENMIEISKRENKIKKLKQEVIDKNVEIEQAHKKAVTNTEEFQNESANLRAEKQRLIEEINQIEQETKAYFEKEK